VPRPAVQGFLTPPCPEPAQPSSSMLPPMPDAGAEDLSVIWES
jgi:hypothetical protein